MPLQYWIHDCARDILGVDELHLDLRNYLDDIEGKEKEFWKRHILELQRILIKLKPMEIVIK